MDIYKYQRVSDNSSVSKKKKSIFNIVHMSFFFQEQTFTKLNIHMEKRIFIKITDKQTRLLYSNYTSSKIEPLYLSARVNLNFLRFLSGSFYYNLIYVVKIFY
jgi:hypothetical protein